MNPLKFLFLFPLFLTLLAKATTPPAVSLNPTTNRYCLQDHALFFTTTDSHLTPEQALQHLKDFRPMSEIQIQKNELDIWVSVHVENPEQATQTIFLNGQQIDHFFLYQIEEGKPRLLGHSGRLVPFDNRPVKDWGSVISTELHANSQAHFLLCFRSTTHSSRQLLDYLTVPCMKLFTAKGYQATYKLSKKLLYFFLGAICIMAIYNLLISFSTQYREYMVFSIYNIIVALVGLILTDQHIELGLVTDIETERHFRYLPMILMAPIYMVFTSFYLELKKRMPVLHRVGLGLTLLYVVPSVAVLLSAFKLAFFAFNILTTGVGLLTLYCSTKLALQHRSARFFLAGNIIVMIIPSLQILAFFSLVETKLMSYSIMAILLTEIMIFSLAVAYKVKVSRKQMMEMALENQKQRLHLASEEQKQKALSLKVEAKSRELVSASVHWINLGDRLNKLEEKILDLKEKKEDFSPQVILKEIKQIKGFEDEWSVFKLHFEEMHPTFFENIERRFPQLSQNDLKLCAFMKMKLSNNEIAIILNVTKKAVEQAKRRMRKKMGLEKEGNILREITEAETL